MRQWPEFFRFRSEDIPNSISGEVAGYYALTGDKADAGYFTARATLKADLGDALSISGTIDRFVGPDGRQRNWSVELQESSFHDILGGNSRGAGSRVREQPTVWTIDGTPAAPDPDRKWTSIPYENGNSIIGSFEAVYGTEGRMAGAFGAER